MFLSIIIPIYNGGKYIDTCLNSILSQDINENDYEIICVDDCSTDDTYNTLLELANNISSLRVLKNSKNLRAGGARNHGVREAKGEYIVFIDADDYFHDRSLVEAFDYQKKHKLDILMCDFARNSETDKNNVLIHNFKSKEVMTGIDFFLINSLPWAPWKFIFKRSLMVDNNIWFEEKVSCEDVDWTHKLAFYAKAMQYQPILLTHQIINQNSQTTTEFRNSNIIWHRFFSGRRCYDLHNNLYKDIPEAKNRLIGIASTQFLEGVFYLNAFSTNIAIKKDLIYKYIPIDMNLHPLVKFARKMPMLYSIISNIFSPFFYSCIVLKRRLKN